MTLLYVLTGREKKLTIYNNRSLVSRPCHVEKQKQRDDITNMDNIETIDHAQQFEEWMYGRCQFHTNALQFLLLKLTYNQRKINKEKHLGVMPDPKIVNLIILWHRF